MKKERDNDVILTTILNKMLEKYNVDVKYVLRHQEINGELWFQYYTMTQKEFDEWKKWTMDYLKTTNIPKNKGNLNRKREFDHINLMWGLKIKEDDNTVTK